MLGQFSNSISYRMVGKEVISLSNIRKVRGYKFEKKTCEMLMQHRGGRAWRLGGSMIELPDVLWVNNDTSEMCAVECKSTASMRSLEVKKHQVERCLEWCDNLKIYESRYALLAFKFPHKIYWHQTWGAQNYKCRPTDGRLFVDLGYGGGFTPHQDPDNTF